MNTILVWVLVISSMNSTKNMAEMFGNFSTLDDCEQVRNSVPFEGYKSQCVRVKLVVK